MTDMPYPRELPDGTVVQGATLAAQTLAVELLAALDAAIAARAAFVDEVLTEARDTLGWNQHFATMLQPAPAEGDLTAADFVDGATAAAALNVKLERIDAIYTYLNDQVHRVTGQINTTETLKLVVVPALAELMARSGLSQAVTGRSETAPESDISTGIGTVGP